MSRQSVVGKKPNLQGHGACPYIVVHISSERLSWRKLIFPLGVFSIRDSFWVREVSTSPLSTGAPSGLDPAGPAHAATVALSSCVYQPCCI